MLIGNDIGWNCKMQNFQLESVIEIDVHFTTCEYGSVKPLPFILSLVGTRQQNSQ